MVETVVSSCDFQRKKCEVKMRLSPGQYAELMAELAIDGTPIAYFVREVVLREVRARQFERRRQEAKLQALHKIAGGAQ